MCRSLTIPFGRSDSSGLMLVEFLIKLKEAHINPEREFASSCQFLSTSSV